MSERTQPDCFTTPPVSPKENTGLFHVTEKLKGLWLQVVLDPDVQVIPSEICVFLFSGSAVLCVNFIRRLNLLTNDVSSSRLISHQFNNPKGRRTGFSQEI